MINWKSPEKRTWLSLESYKNKLGLKYQVIIIRIYQHFYSFYKKPELVFVVFVILYGVRTKFNKQSALGTDLVGLKYQ